MRPAAALAAALLASGCLTSEVSHAPDGVPGDGGEEHMMTVEIENTGWFLFDCIPIACGNPGGLDKCSTSVFSDTLSLQTNIDALGRILEREGAYSIGTLASHEESEYVLIFLLSRRAVHTSATLMKR